MKQAERQGDVDLKKINQLVDEKVDGCEFVEGDEFFHVKDDNGQKVLSMECEFKGAVCYAFASDDCPKEVIKVVSECGCPVYKEDPSSIVAVRDFLEQVRKEIDPPVVHGNWAGFHNMGEDMGMSFEKGKLKPVVDGQDCAISEGYLLDEDRSESFLDRLKKALDALEKRGFQGTDFDLEAEIDDWLDTFDNEQSVSIEQKHPPIDSVNHNPEGRSEGRLRFDVDHRTSKTSQRRPRTQDHQPSPRRERTQRDRDREFTPYEEGQDTRKDPSFGGSNEPSRSRPFNRWEPDSQEDSPSLYIDRLPDEEQRPEEEQTQEQELDDKEVARDFLRSFPDSLTNRIEGHECLDVDEDHRKRKKQFVFKYTPQTHDPTEMAKKIFKKVF